MPLANGGVGPGAKPAGSSFSGHYQPVGTIFFFFGAFCVRCGATDGMALELDVEKQQSQRKMDV